jgi:hypothetical protein
MWNRLLVAFFMIVLFSSCEESMILKSEKKMKEDLQGTWLRSFQGRNPYINNCGADTVFFNEFWKFEGDMLYTTFEYEGIVSCDRGTPDSTYLDGIDTAVVSKFKIDARILDAFLKFQIISGTNDSVITFPDKWEFVTLDNDVLYLATDDPKGNSVLQLEFSKIK